METKAIISVGNPLKSDDNIGNIILDRIKKFYKNKDYHFFKGGMNPENFIEPLKKIDPDVIFFIDVALFPGSVGDVKLFRPEDVLSLNVSTHNLPITTFRELFPKLKMFLIGIKPKDLNFGEGLSPELKSKFDRIEERVKRMIEETT